MFEYSEEESEYGDSIEEQVVDGGGEDVGEDVGEGL